MTFNITDISTDIANVAARATDTALPDMNFMPTGVADYDRRCGGIAPRELILVAGRPGMGASSFSLGIARSVAFHERAAQPVAIVGPDVSGPKLARRILAAESNQSISSIRDGRVCDEAKPPLEDAVARITSGAPVLLLDPTQPTPSAIRAQLEQLDSRGRLTSPLRVLIVDDLASIRAGDGAELDPAQRRSVMYALKRIARDLELTVIVNVTLPRSVEEREDMRPGRLDFRELDNIDEIADTVLALYRPEYYLKDETPAPWQGKSELIIMKHHDAQTGSMIIGWLGMYGKFVDLKPGWELAS